MSNAHFQNTNYCNIMPRPFGVDPFSEGDRCAGKQSGSHKLLWQSPCKNAANLPSVSRTFKGPIFIKNRHFIVQVRFTKLIHCVNSIIKCGT